MTGARLRPHKQPPRPNSHWRSSSGNSFTAHRHLHLRDGGALTSVVPFTARVFGRAIVMPNLKPPVRSLAEATAYRQRVLAAVPAGVSFEPLMTLYLTGAFQQLSTFLALLASDEAGDSHCKLCTQTIPHLRT